MITPINIALLGVVLAAVALVILRRRHSGGTDEAAPAEAPEHAMTPADEPAPAVDDDVFSKHVWAEAEAAATLTPVREDESLAVADDDDESEDHTDREDDAEDPDAESGERDQDTGEIHELDLEAMTEPDDGLGDIITEPGWYLPGETDMTRGSPGSPSGLLVSDELPLSGGPLDDELGPLDDDLGPPPEASAHLPDEDALGFGAAPGWTAPADNAAPAVEPAWLGLADEEGAAAAVEDEIPFEVEPSPSDDLFALPPLEPAVANGAPDAEAPSFPLDRWQDPVTPSPAFAPAPAPAPGDLTVTQHGPLTVSIDPAALLAIETEGIERSSSRADGDVSWELTLRVELRQRANGNGNGSGTTD